MELPEKCDNAKHEWSDWDYTSGDDYRLRVCLECGEVDVDPLYDDGVAVMYNCGCHLVEYTDGEVLQVLSTCSEHDADSWMR